MVTKKINLHFVFMPIVFQLLPCRHRARRLWNKSWRNGSIGAKLNGLANICVQLGISRRAENRLKLTDVTQHDLLPLTQKRLNLLSTRRIGGRRSK